LSEYLRTVFDKFELRVRKGFYYTNDDLWLNIENGKVRIGGSDYLQKTSGDVAFIELPKHGSTVEKGKEFGTIESANFQMTDAWQRNLTGIFSCQADHLCPESD
jgi:glycine cleavage system H lipoate-binding protein